MHFQEKKFTILIANDQEQERFLLEEALREVRLVLQLYFVEDGEQLLDYLYRRAEYALLQAAPLPDLILLDLNMPKKDGREALLEIKTSVDYRHIPIVVLTTSNQESDILLCYQLGANSFIRKPMTFDKLVEVATTLCNYWFETSTLTPVQPE